MTCSRDVVPRHLLCSLPQVLDPGTGLMRADAAVNAGNTLCSSAELLGQQQQQQHPPSGSEGLIQQLELYKQAATMYEVALKQVGVVVDSTRDRRAQSSRHM
jgi:hypothetical protein